MYRRIGRPPTHPAPSKWKAPYDAAVEDCAGRPRRRDAREVFDAATTPPKAAYDAVMGEATVRLDTAKTKMNDILVRA